MNGKMKSCIKGLMMGCCGTPRPLVPEKKEPVAYLYNGVKLSDINAVWTDKKTYPYAIVYPYSNAYMLQLCQTAPYYGYVLNQPRVIISGGKYKKYNHTGGKWNLLSDSEGYTSINATVSYFWTSHDILYQDSNEVYLAASEPVPVYE